MTSIRVDFDVVRCKARFAKNASTAQKWLDMQVRKDTEPYVPMISGDLYRSAIRASVVGSGEIEYLGPYARAQYYGKPNKTTSRHPLAAMKWFEVSKKVNLKNWINKVKSMFGK